MKNFIAKIQRRTQERQLLLQQKLMTPNAPALPLKAPKPQVLSDEQIDRKVSAVSDFLFKNDPENKLRPIDIGCR